MVQSLKLLAAALLIAAPVPALAQKTAATTPQADVAEPAVATPKETPKPLPVKLNDPSGLHHAVFHPRPVIPALPKVQRTSFSDDLPKVEIPMKDSWTEKQGLRIAVTKVRYTAVF